MAYAMTKCGSQDNIITYEFMCDTTADMNKIENKYRTIGTVAIVLQGESDGLEVYIAGSDKKWNSLSSIAGGGGDMEAGSGLTIYICSQQEVSEGLPDIDEPDEDTIYLVPASDPSTGDLYDEYIWVDDNWERFGSGSINIDLSSYATKQDIAGFYTKPNGGIPTTDLAETYLTQHQSLTPLENRITALEAQIASLMDALNALIVPAQAVLDESGTPMMDENGNIIEFDVPSSGT